MSRFFLATVAAALLGGCSFGGDEQELRAWMDEASKGIKGGIPPLPQVLPYDPVTYDVSGLVDPFKVAKVVPEKKSGSGGGIQPDIDRPKEPLEAYPLESLKFVGVMLRKSAANAIILADGALYQVKVGNFMGQSFGKITKITDAEVTLKELVQDPSGDWTERESTLLLQAEEGKK